MEPDVRTPGDSSRAVIEPENRGNVRALMQGPPSGYFIVVPDTQGEAADDLATFTADLLAEWKLLLATAVACGLIAWGVTYLMRPMYRAQALVAPVSHQTSSAGGSALRQLGGIAALAGIDIGIAGGRKEEYLATLSSPGFAREFIRTQNLLPVLFADRWDAQAKQWRPGRKTPTLEQGVKRFTNEVVSISEDRKTSLITVTVEWYSPQLAAQWANGMIELVNERLRADAIRTADSSLEYLNRELTKTNVVEIRQAIYRLTEEQVNNAMLANVQREYAFHVVDAAVPPEVRFSPKRMLIGTVGAAAGLFLGAMAVYVRRVRARRREPSGAHP